MPQSKDLLEKTDIELVKLTLEDQENFLYLMQRYQDKLLRYVLRISNVSMHEAEDILQDVFIKVFKNLNGFDSKYKFSSWIYRITRNEVISNHRKNISKSKDLFIDLDDEVLERFASEFDLIKEIERKDLKDVVAKVLKKLDKKYKDVLILKFMEDKDYQEIAYILKKPMGTVATWLSRAKKEFKKNLNKKDL